MPKFIQRSLNFQQQKPRGTRSQQQEKHEIPQKSQPLIETTTTTATTATTTTTNTPASHDTNMTSPPICTTIKDTSKLRGIPPKRVSAPINTNIPRERSPSSEISESSELSTPSQSSADIEMTPSSPIEFLCETQRVTRAQLNQLMGKEEKQEEKPEEEEEEEEEEQQDELGQQDQPEETTKAEDTDNEPVKDNDEPLAKRLKTESKGFIPAEQILSQFFKRTAEISIPQQKFEDSIPPPLTLHRTYYHLKYMNVPSEFIEFKLPEEEFSEEKAYQAKMAKPEKLPHFKQIDQNKFTRAAMGLFPRRRRNEDEDFQRCSCRKLGKLEIPQSNISYNCGEMCLNRLLCVECDDECCELGEKCENRRFMNKKYAKVEPFKTELKGWGLRACENIPPGTLVVEYIGELIDNAECARRIRNELNKTRHMNATKLKHQKEAYKKGIEKLKKLKEKEAKYAEKLGIKKKGKITPVKKLTSGQRGRARATVDTSDEEPDDIDTIHGGANYYFLTLVDDVIIDAGRKGGVARFTNHSCDPNCVVQKWNVGNGLRVGFFARRMIPAGTEITIDYQYDRIGSLKRQACYCGAANCAKFIGGKKREDDEEEWEDEEGLDPTEKLAQRRRKALISSKSLPVSMADSVCAECARDSGELLMCNGKIGNEHCTRVFHLHCLGMKETPRGRWICPYHVCRDCTSGTPPTHFCRTCADAWCIDCVTPQLANGQVKILPMFNNTEKITWCACIQCQKDPICERLEESHMYHGYEERRRLAEEAEREENVRERLWLQQVCDEMIKEGESTLYRLMTHLEAQRAWEEREHESEDAPFHERWEIDQDVELAMLDVPDHKFTTRFPYEPITSLNTPPNRRLQNILMKRVAAKREAYEEEQDRIAEEQDQKRAEQMIAREQQQSMKQEEHEEQQEESQEQHEEQEEQETSVTVTSRGRGRARGAGPGRGRGRGRGKRKFRS